MRLGLRAGRGTNLALLVLLFGALVTGGLAFAIGGAWAFWALAAHGRSVSRWSCSRRGSR